MKKIILLFLIIAQNTSAQIAQEKAPSFQFQNDQRAMSILDQSISSYVKTRYAVDKKLNAYRMKVHTEERTVILSGQLARDSDAMDAIEMAAATPGVKQVDASMLSVRNSKTSLNDLAITANINGAYTRENLWGNDDFTVATIDVTTRHGVVYLTGNAIDKAQKETAIQLAESIPGVVLVHSDIRIN